MRKILTYMCLADMPDKRRSPLLSISISVVLTEPSMIADVTEERLRAKTEGVESPPLIVTNTIACLLIPLVQPSLCSVGGDIVVIRPGQINPGRDYQ